MSKEKLLVYYNGPRTLYLEDFPEKCERSCKGSKYIPAKRTVMMTQGEYDHFKSTYPKEYKYSRIVHRKTEEGDAKLQEARKVHMEKRAKENKELDKKALGKSSKAQNQDAETPKKSSGMEAGPSSSGSGKGKGSK